MFLQTTKGGVILPEQGLGKVLRGTVISAGPGGRDSVSASRNFFYSQLNL